jgi:hypothetical protein
VEIGDRAEGDSALELLTRVVPGDVVFVEVMTTEEQDRRLAEPPFPELVGVSEIAEIFAVTRQRASALRKTPGFPAPVAELAGGPIWRRGDLTRFAETWPRRRGRPPKVVADAPVSGIYKSSNGRLVAVAKSRGDGFKDSRGARQKSGDSGRIKG